MDYTPIILKNKGVPCEFAKTKQVGEKWERVFAENGEPEKEVLHVRFTNNNISDIEIFFGGLDEWQTKLEKFPITTIRQTLAFCMSRDLLDIGEAMLDGEAVNYSNVIGAAWSIANGVDPTTASRLLKHSVALAEEQRQGLNTELKKAMEAEDSPGLVGTPSGQKRANRSKSSGN